MKFTGVFIRLLAVCLFATGCAPAPVPPSPTIAPSTLPPTKTIEPTATSTQAPSGRVIYDFQELACQAKWTNNGQTLTCPANIYEENTGGYVSLAPETFMEGVALVGDEALETHPAYDGSFRGIFGAFPPINIVAGDEFRATIGCRDGGPNNLNPDCNVEFSLEYYDANNNYVDSQITGWHWNEIDDGQAHPITVDLSALAGETVRFALVVRDDGSPSANDNALWLHPQLWRLH